jgi:FkbM family methyltransferase
MRLGTRLRVLAATPGRRLDIALRGDRDREIFAEIFSRRCYAPPRAFRSARVLDLGANIGLFTAFAIERLGAEDVVAVEPDPGNLQALQAFVARNDLPVTVVPAFASTSDGSVRFEAGLAAESRVALEDSAPAATIEVPTVDVFSLGRFDLAKVDIEGAEWELLSDERFPQLAPVVVMEWHERNSQGRLVADALEDHGYAVEVAGPHVVWAFHEPA